jgi:flagellar motor switch protein FliM
MRTLDQSQIDALFAQAQAAGGKPKAKNVVAFDLRPKRLTQAQLSGVTSLHEAFARRFSYTLAAHLRVKFAMALVSVQQMAYSEFLGLLNEITYFGSVHVMPIDARAGLQFDIALTYPIIDVSLGGSGSETIALRDLTEIEEQILDAVVRLMLLDLQAVWAPVLDLDFQFEQRQRAVQLQSTMQPGEKVLCLGFECHVAECSGTMTLVFPAAIANALLRRLSAQWSTIQRIPSRDSRRRLRTHLLDSRFAVDLSLPHSPLSIRQLIELAPDSVLTLPNRAREPIHLNVAGKPMFLAHPVRSGNNRGARVDRRVSITGKGAQTEE